MPNVITYKIEQILLIKYYTNKLRTLIFNIILFFISTPEIYSQRQIKDTIVDSVSYQFAKYRFNGKIKELRQTKKRKDGGEIIFFDKKGVEKWSGQYNSKGKKDGDWWYKKREIIYYKDGKRTGKKGFGCKGCSF